MAKFTVRWEIEMWDATDARDAAKQALEIMRDPDSTATVFDVIDEHGNEEQVDLQKEVEDHKEDLRARLRKIADTYSGELRDDYSGRGMFGKTCFAISCSPELAHLVIAAAHNKNIASVDASRQDSLGRDTIVYWPGLST